jgi:3-deoxy-D-manno-octulosonic acid (KDO) 8-phosphate synthase
MKVLVKSRVQEFFDVNGMDVMSASSIPSVIFDGIEYVSEDSAVDYVYKSSFSLLYKDLLSYAPSIVI